MEAKLISDILNPHGINIFQDYKINDELLFHFNGSESSIYKAFTVLESHGLRPFEIRRLYGKHPVYKNQLEGDEVIGEAFYEPINEIAYLI